MTSVFTFDDDPVRVCECILMRPTPPLLRLTQRLRWLLKHSIWDGLTGLLDRIGLTLQTVQVLCLDREAEDGHGRVLLLMTREYAAGVCPVQGLRAGLGPRPPWRRYADDPRIDAQRELTEEALLTPLPLERFRPVLRYREGRYGQFDCSVFVVDGRMADLTLRGETAEGIACWARLDEAARCLGNPVLTPILLGVAAAPTGAAGGG